MKKLHLSIFTIVLSCHIIYAQITTMEEPVSFGHRSGVPTLTRSERTMKSFATLDIERIEQKDREDERNGLPPRFGYPHRVNYDLNNSGEWITLPNGDRIWRLTISCQGARSINLLYDRFWIPDGAKFFVYSNDRNQIIGAVTSANNKGDRDNIQGFATGLIFGDQITLEYYLPSEVRETGIISISNVVHGYRHIPAMSRGLGDSCPGLVNVNCSEGDDWQNEKNAVAMILVNGTRNCSGALINTTANNGRPFFLTADHCLYDGSDSTKYDADSAPNLNHWVFYWHYESPDCTNPDTEPLIRSTVGATVLANSSHSDFALLRLTEDPRNAHGVTPYYLGWSRDSYPGWGGVGIHHPWGDIKKISTYNWSPTSSTHNTLIYNANNAWRVSWEQTDNGLSAILPGSSGSPLINRNRHVIGQLWGVLYPYDTVCTNILGQRAYYGKFNVSWNGYNTTDRIRRLSDWLDPLDTGVWTLDGCNGVAHFTNQTVTTDTTFTNTCGAVNISNVTITSTGTLTVQAKAVNIGNNFIVQLGAGFNINIVH